MRFRPQALLIIGFGIGPVLLAAGCSGDGSADGPGGTLVNIQPTSFVVKEPETSTTTTTIAFTAVVAGGRSPTEQTYIVQPGDSLSLIASIHDITSEVLVSYNAVAWPEGAAHTFFPNEEVKIPPDSKIPGTATDADTGTAGETDTGGGTPATGTTANGGECPTTYTVAAGDTSRIKVAAKFDLTYQQLDAANTGTPGYANFVVGTVITVPCPS
jgi:LysM repeat protein